MSAQKQAETKKQIKEPTLKQQPIELQAPEMVTEWSTSQSTLQRALGNPPSLTALQAQGLQRSLGNQALGQTSKLTRVNTASTMRTQVGVSRSSLDAILIKQTPSKIKDISSIPQVSAIEIAESKTQSSVLQRAFLRDDTRQRYREFIDDAQRYGMPVRFLNYVESEYSIRRGAQDAVTPFLNQMTLEPETLDSVEQMSPLMPIGEATGIQTIYHESTHAYFDLKSEDREVSSMIHSGEAHYENAPLKDGAVADDPERLFQEAAAEYVGHRVSTWWQAFERLSLAASGRIKQANIPEWIRRARNEYNDAMAERTFGYQETGGFLGFWTTQTETSRQMSERLKRFLDTQLLEGKIPDNFDEVAGFWELIDYAMGLTTLDDQSETSTSIQPKLTVGPPNDKYEREADQVAKAVVAVTHSDKPTSAEPSQLQRACACGKVAGPTGQCDECRQRNSAGPSDALHRDHTEKPLFDNPIQRQQQGVSDADIVDSQLETKIQRARGTGQQLSDEVRMPMEEAFGADFSNVRVHTGSESGVLNRSLSARAFTTEQDIFFGEGEYNPRSLQGKELLAHELTHVVQQNANTINREKVPNIQRGDPDAGTSDSVQLRFPFYENPDPLAQYSVLREAAPSVWSNFDRSAKKRTLESAMKVQDNEQNSSSEIPLADITEAMASVISLVRPKIPPLVSSDLKSLLWPVVSASEPEPYSVATIVQNEIMARWALQNSDIVMGEVSIRLLEPLEIAPGQIDISSISLDDVGPSQLSFTGQGVLAFSVNGQRIDSKDGSLDILALDLLGSNNLETIVKEVSSEAQVIAIAGDLLREARQYVTQQLSFWADVRSNPDGISLDQVRQNAFNDNFLGLRLHSFLTQHPEYTDAFGGFLDQFMEVFLQSYERFNAYHDYHDKLCKAPDLETMADASEGVLEQGSQFWSQGDYFVATMQYLGGGLGSSINWLGNTFTADYFETRRQAIQAFCRGNISYSEMTGISDAAAGRGAIFGIVTIGLSLATAGLASAALGTGATVGRTILFAGAGEAVTGLAATGVGSAMTGATEFDNPVAQQIWGQGKRSLGDIATAGVISFGFGAAGAAAGIGVAKLATWLKQLKSNSGSALARTAEPPPGWVAEQVAPDVYRFTHTDVPEGVIISPSDLRYQNPTGDGIFVEFDNPFNRVLTTGSAHSELSIAKAVLSDFALDDDAIIRILAKGNELDHVKGQLFEELMMKNVRSQLAEGGSESLGVASREGVEVIGGERITDLEGAQLTDGILASRHLDGSLEILTVFEAKSGRASARGLAYSKSELGDVEDFARFMIEEQPRQVIATLRQAGLTDDIARVKAGSESLSDEAIEAIAADRQLRSTVIQAEMGGQVRMDVERLAPGDGEDMASIFIDGVPTPVRFSPTRTRFVGALPEDVAGDAIARRIKSDSINFELMSINVKGENVTAAAQRLIDRLNVSQP